ncbi:protein of unknown function (plasmid) [Azospirillum baldaniorum]|uniref:Uncharacterized protein n=1 Tax=Azospirillum baldaniorum TaxID=1064539 RepID=A0A9P1NPZ0_9PROT|nr:protein of unknown function [Azospirillum baldaniorum]
MVGRSLNGSTPIHLISGAFEDRKLSSKPSILWQLRISILKRCHRRC